LKQIKKKRTIQVRKGFLARALAVLVLASSASCSVEKNTSLSRNYHNLTSHYNVYFNGNESYKKGLEKARSSVKLDFTSILPVFLYEDDGVHRTVNADMKRAIDKATKVITFHSITAKPKVKEGDQSEKDKAFFARNEYNKWVDDSYMLMGKSYMYQGEYFLAMETFKHVLVTFPADEIRFLAMIWLARGHIMINEMREAERILTSLADEDEMPMDDMEPLLTTRAQFELKRESYAAAAAFLDEALNYRRISKEDKIRYTYILAQLYEKAGENDLALEKYKRVTRYNPPYEMAFNARVSMAEVFTTGSAGSDDLKKLLNKMLRDSKNKEYKDQIYFALGNIAMEEGEHEKAIEYYQLSVSSSIQNQYQKGLSAVTLAEIYYNEPDYPLSAAYYDSAVSFLNTDYPGYRTIQQRAGSLGNLVYYDNTYELQDSLQRLAAMPEEDLLKVIDGIIEQVRQEEEAKRLAEQQAMQDMAYNQTVMMNNPQGSQSTQQGGTWYFYNLNAKSFGQPEFRMKWGDRKLEDNWRRSNKQTVSGGAGGNGADGDSIEGGENAQIFDNKSREFYLVNIPLTDSAMEVSNGKMEEALYNLGKIYKTELLDFEKSRESFEELVRRFPGSEYMPEVLYTLYELAGIRQDQAGKDRYFNRLTRGYPDSHYAKLLTNPNYINELEEAEMKVTRIYEGIFEKYRKKEYTAVIAGADSALVMYPSDKLAPKFKYIRALSVGAIEGKEAMKVELDSLIAQNPGTDESTQAREIIDYMFEAFPVIKEAEEARVAEEIYTTYDSTQQHYFLLALNGEENVNQVSFELLNFNLDNYNEYDLNIERLSLKDGYNMLVVKTFNSAMAARRYMEAVTRSRDTILAGVPSGHYKLMIISLDNFVILSEQKVHNPYYLFYRKYYENQD
jgi:tetratricopeptide (TPR) repeat protein